MFFIVRIVSAVDETTTRGQLFSGVAITENRVVTVGQAISGFVRWIIGEFENGEWSYQETGISLIHPEYNNRTLQNNIGLIISSSPIDGYFRFNIIEPQPPNTFAFAFGLGIDNSNLPTEIVQAMPIQTLSRQDCIQRFNTLVVRDTNFCVFPTETSLFAGGDQGGPIMNFGRTELSGILSFWDTNVPEGQRQFGVYISLNAFEEFILSDIFSDDL